MQYHRFILFFHQPPFYLVFQVLGNEFFGPEEFIAGPALRMEGQHYLWGEAVIVYGPDDVGG